MNPLEERAATVVYIGSFAGRKRGWLAERTWKQALASRPQLQLHVIGPEEDRDRFDPRVQHSAGLSDSAVQRLIASSLVLIAPSKYEGFGIPAWEAMRRGTPVLATPNPGSLWQAQEGGGIVLADEGDLPRALTELVTSPETWARASQAALAGGERITGTADPLRYYELYIEVLKGRSRKNGRSEDQT